MSGRVTQPWAPSAWVVRALMVLGPILAALATGPAGAGPAAWLLLVIAALALWWAANPGSSVGTAVLLLVMTWWGVGLRDGLSWWAVPAAAGLVTAHVAATLADYGPPELAVSPASARRWAARGLAVVLTTPLVVGAVLWARTSTPPDGVWISGLATAFVVVVLGLAAYVRAASASHSDSSGSATRR